MHFLDELKRYANKQTDERLKLMEYLKKDSKRGGSLLGAGSLFASAVLVGLFLATPASYAQQPAPSKQPAKPAKQSKGDWIKLCAERDSVNAQGVAAKQKVCVIQHERLSMVNGSVVVSAGLRQISGAPSEQLIIQVSLFPNVTGSPFGLAMAPGAQVKIDDGKEIPLKYSFCHPRGCTAETPATKEIIDQLKKGQKLIVIFTNTLSKRLGLPVPLNGFTKAYEGQPFDTKKYEENRRALLVAIQKRQIELAKRAAAAKKKKGGAGAQSKAPAVQPAPAKKP